VIPAASGAVALITGAGRGIGRATAEAFAGAGHTVVLAEREPRLGRGVERNLRRRGHRAAFLRTDVADPSSIRRTVSATLRRFGRIDCLVNNAGVLTVGPLTRTAERDLDRMLAVNLRGPILLARAVLPVMRRRGSGSIVNIASQLGKSAAAEYATYCASKFGLVGFTEALAEELSGTGIDVWAVCPGLVDTPMARKTGRLSRADRAGLIRPESVARVILDLATARRRDRSGSAVDVVSDRG
jgi:NAD(P)-dependent dehydrogenase (short-subunit alcohol dehydrogenase family)